MTPLILVLALLAADGGTGGGTTSTGGGTGIGGGPGGGPGGGLARSNCFNADGGVSVHRIGACVVTCLGEDSTAVLVDGGSCAVSPIKVGLMEGGDFWGPGERPAERNRKRK